MRSVNTLVTLWYLESSCIWFAFWSCSIGRCALHLSWESHSARLALLLIALPRWWGKFGLGSPVNSSCCCLCSCHIFRFAFAVSLLTAALWESFLAGIKYDCGSTCWMPEPVNQTGLCQHLKNKTPAFKPPLKDLRWLKMVCRIIIKKKNLWSFLIYILALCSSSYFKIVLLLIFGFNLNLIPVVQEA